jgi:hypothetical protein
MPSDQLPALHHARPSSPWHHCFLNRESSALENNHMSEAQFMPRRWNLQGSHLDSQQKMMLHNDENMVICNDNNATLKADEGLERTARRRYL